MRFRLVAALAANDAQAAALLPLLAPAAHPRLRQPPNETRRGLIALPLRQQSITQSSGLISAADLRVPLKRIVGRPLLFSQGETKGTKPTISPGLAWWLCLLARCRGVIAKGGTLLHSLEISHACAYRPSSQPLGGATNRVPSSSYWRSQVLEQDLRTAPSTDYLDQQSQAANSRHHRTT